jgi:4-hydroxy-tetrahydrodipicolinate reductase
MQVFLHVVEEAARRFAKLSEAGAFIHESHHSAKKDAPSGTAILLRSAMESAGYGRPIDVSSTRAGSIPGTHRVGFDSLSESVTLIHEVRSRAVFAQGALEAAKWLKGKRGWFSMNEMLNDN